MRKKLFTMALMGSLILAGKVQAYAVTPQYKPPKTDFTMEEIVNAVKDYFKDNPIKVDIDLPESKLNKTKITQAIYRHGKAFYDRTRLQVRWDKVNNADYYKVKITKVGEESKTYKTSNTSLFIYEGSDDFVQSCIKSGTVEVRACGGNGLYSEWSDKKIISCNSIHR